MKKILVDCLSSQLRAALINDGVLEEVIIDEKTERPRCGDIYIGRVDKILPSKIAFVNIGCKNPAFLQLTDFREKNTNIKCGDEIAVQVLKEEIDDKRAVVTTEISVAGKYSVLSINGKSVGVSKKIEDTQKREELKNIGEKYLAEGYGVIMRTNCVSAEVTDIESELEDLKLRCEDIAKKAVYTKAPATVQKATDVVEAAVRDLLTGNDEVVINDRSEFEKVCKNLYGNKVTLYDEAVPLFLNYGVETQLEKALHHRIWLDCGGWIDIEYTEAMTVIDVNSGKFNGSAIKVNMQAATESARQIRLRNLSGMIIIDFINMKSAEDNKKLYELLSELVKKDRVRVNIVGMTDLGLMELTRKKVRRPLHKLLAHSCPYCDGRGYTENELYLADKIRAKIVNVFASTIYKKVRVTASERLIRAVRGNDDCKTITNKFGGEIELVTTQVGRGDYYKLDIEK